MLPADERVRRVIVSSLLPRAGACSETNRVDQTGQTDRVVKVSEEGGSQHRGGTLRDAGPGTLSHYGIGCLRLIRSRTKPHFCPS